MRVGVDATSWTSRRGFGRFARNAVGRLIELDSETTYVLVTDDAGADADELPAGAGVCRVALARRSAEAAAAGSSRGVPDLLRLTRAVRRERFDAFLFPSLYTWFPVVGVPTIVGVHDTMIEDLPELTVASRRERVAVNLKHRLGIRRARTLFTVSETARSAIGVRYGIPAAALRVVPEAPDAVFAPRSGPVLAGGLAAAGLGPGDRFFLCFGGISPHKNVESLVDAYAQLRGSGAAGVQRLVLVGELEEGAYLSAAAAVRARIAHHALDESVILPGFVSDETLACLCSAATAVVLPSLAEGFGLPAVEAAACGAPLALSDLPAHRETLGDAALYFPPLDVGAQAAVLERLAGDDRLRADLAERGRAAVAARTWDAAARELAALVAETVRGA